MFVYAIGSITTKKADAKPTATRHDMFVEKLSAIPEIAELGPLFKSSQPVELTGESLLLLTYCFLLLSFSLLLESETEYTVRCIKHIFPDHLVLQFDCTNTLNDQLLEQVQATIELPEGFELVKTIPLDRLEYNVPGTFYVILATPEDLGDWSGTASPVLKFVVKDCDPNTGEPDSDEG